MNKNLFKSISLVFSLAVIIFLITVSCKTAPTETIGPETTATETTTVVTTSETTSSETTSTETTTSETTSETSTEITTTTTTTTTGQDTNLTQQQAIDIAMTVAAGTVDRVETEIEDGRLVWKVRIISNGVRTDVRIDDETGTVIRVETK